ncbi:MAG TPA: hypothetical protein VKU84_15770, partial [Stellaceae bacterium]|nr:hypothetical protein [Stellaceae bacterium]
MRAVAVLCAVAALASPIPAWAELNMQPGMWDEIKTVGSNQLPPERKCYLQKDVDALDGFQRGTAPAGKSPCSASGYKAVGNFTSYTLTCAINGMKSVSAVTLHYDGTRITGEI